MKYCTKLYCTIKYCTKLYCTIKYCTKQCCTIKYCTKLHCTIKYCTKLYCTIKYCTNLYCTIKYRSKVYCTIQDWTSWLAACLSISNHLSYWSWANISNTTFGLPSNYKCNEPYGSAPELIFLMVG